MSRARPRASTRTPKRPPRSLRSPARRAARARPAAILPPSPARRAGHARRSRGGVGRGRGRGTREDAPEAAAMLSPPASAPSTSRRRVSRQCRRRKAPDRREGGEGEKRGFPRGRIRRRRRVRRGAVPVPSTSPASQVWSPRGDSKGRAIATASAEASAA